MGIKCEINLFKHPDNAYKPGDTIQGTIKYTLSEETQFNRTIVSLKGLGKLEVTHRFYNGKTHVVVTHKKNETYVDIDDIVIDNNTKASILAGTHEIPFSFELPQNVPPTFKYNKNISSYQVNCKIFYYIRVKFEKPGFLSFDKRFKTKIKVDSNINTTLPTSPITYGSEKIPFNLFMKKDKVIKIDGTVENSVIHAGGQVRINYELKNGTKLDINKVKIKLTQEITFNCGGTFPNQTEEVTLTNWKATPIKGGDTQIMSLIIDVPRGVSTIQHTQLVFRNYFVCVVADLPMPHRKAILKMPIEIMDNQCYDSDTNDYDLPPSYSEAMEECKKDELIEHVED